MLQEIETYEDLLKVLSELTPEQLKNKVQVMKPSCNDDEVLALMPAIAIGTVDGAEYRFVRSSVDNRRHGDEVIILTDYNGHGKNGAIAYELDEDRAKPTEEEYENMDTEQIFDLYFRSKPIFPKSHDDYADWTGPAQALFESQEDADSPNILESKRLAIELKRRCESTEIPTDE